MNRLLIFLLPLFVPALVFGFCQPEIGMTKEQVRALCGAPDYAEILQEDDSGTALPFQEEDWALAREEGVTVVWHYDPFDEENSRMVLFRQGLVVHCCRPFSE
jgi:hypothetical protein